MTHLSYAMVFVSDMARSVAFYRDVLGLPLRFESPDWSEFDTPGVTLALHPTPAAPGPVPRPVPAGTCRLGFAVDDINAFHARVTALGVACLSPPAPQDFGVTLAEYADPDGAPFSVSQRRV